MLAKIASFLSPKKKERQKDEKPKSLGCELNDIMGYELIHIVEHTESTVFIKNDAPTQEEASASLVTVGKDMDGQNVPDKNADAVTDDEEEDAERGQDAKNDEVVDIEDLSGEELRDIFGMMDVQNDEDKEPAHAAYDGHRDGDDGDGVEYSDKSEGVDDIDDGLDNLGSEMTEEEMGLAFYPKNPELYEDANRKAYEMMDILCDAHDREMDDRTQRAMEALSRLKLADGGKKDNNGSLDDI